MSGTEAQRGGQTHTSNTRTLTRRGRERQAESEEPNREEPERGRGKSGGHARTGAGRRRGRIPRERAAGQNTVLQGKTEKSGSPGNAGAPGRDRGGHPGWGRRAGAEAPGGLPQGGRLRSTLRPAAPHAEEAGLGAAGLPQGLLAALHPPAVNLGGQAALLLAISEGQLRSIFRDTGSQCHLSRGPDEWAATSIRPLWPLWPPLRGAKAALNLSPKWSCNSSGYAPWPGCRESRGQWARGGGQQWRVT